MGALREFVDIITTKTVITKNGFKPPPGTGKPTDTVVLSTRAAVETKNRTERWANLAAFATANAIFRIRKPPDGVVVDGEKVEIDSTMRVGWKNEQYRIISVEDVRQRGMYLELIAEKIEGSKW